MYKMHDVKDEGGTPVWYCQSMKPTLENQTHAIEKMNLNIEKAMFLVEQHYKKRG